MQGGPVCGGRAPSAPRLAPSWPWAVSPGLWSAHKDGEGLAGASDPVLPLSTPSRGTTL